MSWQNDFIFILKTELEKRKRENPSYSIRAFAASLGLGSGPLSELLKGSRVWNYSQDWALNIVNKIDIQPHMKRRFEATMGVVPSENKFVSNTHFPNLNFSDDILTIPSFILYNSMSIEQFKLYMKTQLHLSDEKIEALVSEFQTINGGQKIEGNFHFNVSSSEEAERKKIIKYIESESQVAVKVLEEKKPEEYGINSITFRGSKERIDFLKTEVQKLLDRAPALVDNGPENDQVYRFSISILPLLPAR